MPNASELTLIATTAPNQIKSADGNFKRHCNIGRAIADPSTTANTEAIKASNKYSSCKLRLIDDNLTPRLCRIVAS